MDHTPGPWRIGIGINESIAGVYAGQRICLCCGNPARIEFSNEDRANARLIAAAPELLDALKALRNACDDQDDDQEFLGAMLAADKAIEKAEGR